MNVSTIRVQIWNSHKMPKCNRAPNGLRPQACANNKVFPSRHSPTVPLAVKFRSRKSLGSRRLSHRMHSRRLFSGVAAHCGLGTFPKITLIENHTVTAGKFSKGPVSSLFFEEKSGSQLCRGPCELSLWRDSH